MTALVELLVYHPIPALLPLALLAVAGFVRRASRYSPSRSLTASGAASLVLALLAAALGCAKVAEALFRLVWIGTRYDMGIYGLMLLGVLVLYHASEWARTAPELAVGSTDAKRRAFRSVLMIAAMTLPALPLRPLQTVELVAICGLGLAAVASVRPYRVQREHDSGLSTRTLDVMADWMSAR
jgi:hypothetical protein